MRDHYPTKDGTCAPYQWTAREVRGTSWQFFDINFRLDKIWVKSPSLITASFLSTSPRTVLSIHNVAVVVKSCLTPCKHMDCSPPGSSVHGILQVRVLEWVAIPFSRGPSPPKDWTQVSCHQERLQWSSPTVSDRLLSWEKGELKPSEGSGISPGHQLYPGAPQRPL